MRKVKCSVVGDHSIGKTSLILAYLTGYFQYFNTISLFDEYQRTYMYENTEIDFQIADTCPNEFIDGLFEYSFFNSNIFIVCFSLVDPFSFQGVNRWINEINQRYSNIYYILVGLKSDLRDNFEENILYKCYEPIETSRGEQKKEEINAVDYIECSSLIFSNVYEVFELAIKNVLKKQTMQKSTNDINSCCLIH